MQVRTVVIVNDFASINGGAGQVAISSAMGLAAKGYRVILFAAVGPVNESLRESGIEVVCLNQYDILNDPKRIRAVIQGIWNVKGKMMFEKLLGTLNKTETIVHFHSWSKALSSSLLLVAKKRDFKVIITLHDYFIYCPNGGFYDYQHSKICMKKPLGIACVFCNCDARSYVQKIWRCIRQVVQNRVLYQMDNIHFLSISDLSTHMFQEHYPNKKSVLYRVDNPVEIFSSIERIPVENNECYLFVARLSLEKGIDLFCEAVSQLGLKGCVLGDGYLLDVYKKKYPMIKFTGWVTGKEKEYYIKTAKVLVFSSKCYETFGLSVAEMQSCGIPCIVPDMNAAAELVVDGETGFVFQTGNLESLKEKMDCIEKTDREELIKMSQQAFNSSPNGNYSMDTHLNNLIRKYNLFL